MKYLSLFSGIGGFELGIQQAYVDSVNRRTDGRGEEYETNDDEEGKRLEPSEGKNFDGEEGRNGEHADSEPDEREPTCVGYSEIDRYAIQIYQKHFNHTNYGDITNIVADNLPDFDFLVGGFPCQSFSIAGKRKGFSDTRGTLFFDIARILQAKQPTRFLLENVKGLLSHDNGRTFGTIIATLDELGYDLQWQVLNSKNFGVPQNRERVFIIGHLRGAARSEVFPFSGGNEQIAESNQPESGGSKIAQSITTTYWKGGKGSNIVAPTIRATEYKHGDNQTLIAHTVRSSGRASGIEKKQNWDSYLVEGKIRRLTPTECERLQGFPGGWTEYGVHTGISDTQRYKCLGNAVTVNVIQAIMEKLLTLPN